MEGGRPFLFKSLCFHTRFLLFLITYLRVSPLCITADGLFVSMEEIHDLLDDFRLSITTRGRPLLESIVVISVAAVIWKGRDTKGIRDAEAGLVASCMPTNGGFCEDLLKCGFTPIILVWIRLKTWFFNLIYLTPHYHQQQQSRQTRQLQRQNNFLICYLLYIISPENKTLCWKFNTCELKILYLDLDHQQKSDMCMHRSLCISNCADSLLTRAELRGGRFIIFLCVRRQRGQEMQNWQQVVCQQVIKLKWNFRSCGKK